MTATVVGLGMVTIVVVSDGVESLSNELSTALTDIELTDRFAQALADLGLVSMDFSNGAGAFSGGSVVSMPGMGDVLQIGPNEAAGASFAMPPGTSSATVEFDLFGMDSLNNETATVSVNGEVAGTVTVDQGVATFTPVNGGTTTFEASNLGGGSDLNGNGEADSRTQVRLTVGNPGETLDVQIHSGAAAGVANESFAIDNMSVSAN